MCTLLRQDKYANFLVISPANGDDNLWFPACKVALRCFANVNCGGIV